MDGHDAFGISKSYVPGQGYRSISELSAFERRGLKMSLQAKKAKAAKTNQAIPGMPGSGKASKSSHYLRQMRKTVGRVKYEKGGQQ